MKIRLGFLFAFALITIGFSSCEEDKLARAEVTVLQEYTATHGQLLQTRPMEGVEVHFYVPRNGTEHLEAIEITDSEGWVSFEYAYDILVHADVELNGDVIAEGYMRLEEGKTVKETIIVTQ
jgi:hypothetical protein